MKILVFLWVILKLINDDVGVRHERHRFLRYGREYCVIPREYYIMFTN